MAGKKLLWGILALSLVFGMMVLGARKNNKSSPYDVLESVAPDENSAVVYFFGLKGKGNVWDGETPIGSFYEIKPMAAGLAWKTTPGPHYFMTNASNWSVILADLEPNKRYYVYIRPLPSPPRTTLITMQVLSQKDGEAWYKQIKKPISFTDAWRAEFAQDAFFHYSGNIGHTIHYSTNSEKVSVRYFR